MIEPNINDEVEAIIEAGRRISASSDMITAAVFAAIAARSYLSSARRLALEEAAKVVDNVAAGFSAKEAQQLAHQQYELRALSGGTRQIIEKIAAAIRALADEAGA